MAMQLLANYELTYKKKSDKSNIEDIYNKGGQHTIDSF